MRVAALCFALVASASGARAEDLEEKGFGLRFTAALSRFSRYPDSAGIGGAGGGSPWSSSPNPASSGMNPAVGPRRFGASAQYAHVFFDEGTDVDVVSVSGAYDGGGWGSWQPSFLAVTTDRAETADGLTFEWDAWGVELQWGREIDGCTALGVNLSVLDSDTEFDLGPLEVSDGRSTTYGVRVGALHEFSTCLHAGVAVEWSAAPSETTLHDFLALGTGDATVEDTTHALLVRPGIYAHLGRDLTLYADYQFARFSDDTGSLVTHRVAAGLDLTVTRGLYARAGGIVDRWGNLSVTAGIGLAPSERLMIDLSVQANMFPEIEPEFGRAHVLGIGVTVLF
jgi:hypothetical protein